MSSLSLQIRHFASAPEASPQKEKLEGDGPKDEQAKGSRKLTIIFLDSPVFGLVLERI